MTNRDTTRYEQGLTLPYCFSFSKVTSLAGVNPEETKIIETLRGSVTVAWKGNRSKTALVTYHDLGLNHISNFKSFFEEADMGELLPNFCVYHINAPGQEFGAEKLPEGFVYPSMDDLCDQVQHGAGWYDYLDVE